MNELTGGFGEMLVKFFCKHFTDALVLHDVIIDGADGHTSQIDFVLIDKKGIFVVEVKLFTDAKVYGDWNKSTWYYYLNGKKYEIYSPKKQNAKHVEYLKKLLADFGDIPYFSVITMICDDFKVSNMNGEGLPEAGICNSLPSMKEVMRMLTEGRPDVLDDAKRQEIFDFISERRYSSPEARYEHKKQVKEYQKTLAEKKTENVCPRCGAPLVLRKGKFGAFYGCSNYPKCRFTRQADE